MLDKLWKNKKILYFLLFILYFLAICLFIQGTITSKLIFVMFLPFLLTVGICFMLVPVTFLALMYFSVIQFVKKDFTRYNKVFKYLIFMTSIGYVGMLFCNIVFGGYFIDDLPLMKIPFTVLCIIFVLVLLAEKKQNTKYYLLITVPMLLFALLGVEFGYLFR